MTSFLLMTATVLQTPGAGGFDPLLPGLILLLPLLGFAVNGALALAASGESAARLRAGETPPDFTGEARPLSHRIPTWVGPGVMLGAFVLTVLNFVRMVGSEVVEPVVRSYWTWMPTGSLTVDAAIQLDALSIVMMLVVTGVGFLIHVFSVGYMKDDPGYPRYFAYLNLFVFFMLVLVTGANF
ncbi:MAG: hypothetical protein EA352_00070, partial [Gemmatimonadales bacterium]